MNYVEAQGLVHIVHTEHFESGGDGRRSIKLDLECGGHVFLEPDFPWKHEGIATCLWCIVGESRHRMEVVGITTGRMSCKAPNISLPPRALGKPR